MPLLTDSHIESIEMPENLAVSMMVAMQRMACQQKGCDEKIVHYAFGGSPFSVPEVIQERLKASCELGEYGPAEGMEPLRKEIAGYWKRNFDLDVDPARIVVTPGSKWAIYLALAMLSGPVILPAPSWVGYLPIAQLLRKEIIRVPTRAEDGYRLTGDGLRSAVAGSSAPQKMLILNSPNNPTGAVYSRSELEAIADACRDLGIIVISDEIYSLITFDASRFVSMASIYPERTFVTNALSKHVGSGGYRLGFIILPAECSEQQLMNFRKVGASTYTNAPGPIQGAAAAAFDSGPEIEAYIEAQRNMHRIMTKELHSRFVTLPGVTSPEPEGSFYFFADFEGYRDRLNSAGLNTSREVAKALLAHPHHIATVSGEALIMPPESLTFRIAAVDYDGAASMADYQSSPPASPEAEKAFAEKHTGPMFAGVETMRAWMEAL